MYNADGTNYTSASGTSGEFRINAITLGDQVTPAISTAANGTIAVAWAGPANNGSGPGEDVYSRVMNPTLSFGPKISGVYVVPASGVMSWNAQSSKGVSGASLKIDGAADSKVYGPYPAASGVNFSGAFARWRPAPTPTRSSPPTPPATPRPPPARSPSSTWGQPSAACTSPRGRE